MVQTSFAQSTWWLLSSQHFSIKHPSFRTDHPVAFLWCKLRCSLCSFRLPGSPGRSAEIFGQSPEDMLFDWEQSGWVGKLTHFESTNNHFLSTRCWSTPTKKWPTEKGRQRAQRHNMEESRKLMKIEVLRQLELRFKVFTRLCMIESCWRGRGTQVPHFQHQY